MDKTVTPPVIVGQHPLVRDVNAEQDASLTPLEHICKSIADWTGAPLALMAAILIQAVWIIVGIVTHWDPFPFAFLLTVSNVLQLILIFILAVGQKQSSEHAERRAESDHEAISRLLYHQEAQEQILLALAAKIECDVTAVRVLIERLASEDPAQAPV
jgi:uncharacterized membrane protein